MNEIARLERTDPLSCSVCGKRVVRLGGPDGGLLVDEGTIACVEHSRGYVPVKAQARAAAAKLLSLLLALLAVLSLAAPAEAQISASGGGIAAGGTAGGPITITTGVAPALTINDGATTGNYQLIQTNGAVTAAGTITGLAIDLTGVSGGLTNMVQGLSITGPATTAAKAAGSALALFNSRGTRAKIAAFRGRNVSSLQGSMVSVDWDQATTLTGQTVMFTLEPAAADASTNNVNFCTAYFGAPVTTATTATTATGAGALDVLGTSALTLFSRMTAATVLDVVGQNTSGTLAAVRYPSGLTTTRTGATTMLSLDATSNAAGNVQTTGLSIAVNATTVAAAAGVAALAINSDATLQRVLDVDCANTSGTLGIIRYGTGTTLSSTALVGLHIDLSTNVTAATNDPPITGVLIDIPATDIPFLDGRSALRINSLATQQSAFEIAHATAQNGVGIINTRYGTATTLTGSTVAWVLDMTTNVTGGGQQIRGFEMFIGNSTATVAASTSRAALFDYRIPGCTTGIVQIGCSTANTLAAAFIGLSVDLITNITHGSQVVTGLSIGVVTGAASGSAAIGFKTGQGATIPHLLGPTDQNLLLSAGASSSAVGRACALLGGDGNGAGNAGGAITGTSGAGVNGAAGAAGSNAGAFTWTSGAAGTTGTGTAGNAGVFTITAVVGGACGTSGTGGVGSAFLFTGGAGGATNTTTGGAGGGWTATTGAGGNGGTTGGVAGSMSFTLGAAGTGGNVNGATFNLTLGARTGSGTQGAFNVKTSAEATALSVSNAGTTTALGYVETVNALGSVGGGTSNIDLALGNVVTVTLTDNQTLTVSNVPATNAYTFRLFVTTGTTNTITWFAGVIWPGGVAPSQSASNVKDTYSFTTFDAGTTWYGMQIASDSK